jgi:hypothetical protein
VSTALQPAAHPDWDRLQRTALLAAAGGVVAFVLVGLIRYFVAGLHSPVQFFLSYLVAFNFWLSIPLGCLVLLMLQYLTGGAWGVLLRRVLESGTRTLFLVPLLFVPLLPGLFLGGSSLYLWARPLEQVAQGDALEELRGKAVYLDVPFFLARAAVYFACWLLLGYLLLRWSAEEPAGEVPRTYRLLPRVSGPGLVVYGLTITFASVDWVMSLEPFWYSTIYPVIYAVGQVLAGFAFAVGVVILLARRGPLAGVVRPEHLRDLGSLLLAFVLFWAYMSFSQFLLIWVGNLPEEIPWYLRRSRGGWQWVVIALALLHFALPFLLLLFRGIKENPEALAILALGLLGVRLLDVFWWIEPAYPHDEAFFWLLDLAAVTAVGGLWVWMFLDQLRRRPLLPADAAAYLEAPRHE